MRLISEYINTNLILEQPSIFKRNYILTAGEEVVAEMKYIKLFSSAVGLDIAGEKWEIKKENLFSRRIGIYQYGYEMPFANYSNKRFGSGVIELPMGNTLHANYKFFKGTTEVLTSSGKLLFSTSKKNKYKEKLIFSIPLRNELLDKNPWLILLIGYIDINRRSGAAYAG